MAIMTHFSTIRSTPYRYYVSANSALPWRPIHRRWSRLAQGFEPHPRSVRSQVPLRPQTRIWGRHGRNGRSGVVGSPAKSEISIFQRNKFCTMAVTKGSGKIKRPDTSSGTMISVSLLAGGGVISNFSICLRP
jgi:hypothetical protein